MLDPRDYSSDDPRASRHELLSSSSKVPTPVSAPQASLVVTTLADIVDATDGQLSLREAIGAANDQAGSDTITFADSIRGGSVVLSLGQLVITDDLAIDGTGETIDANGKSRVLRVDGPDGGTRLDVAIDDLTIFRGHVEGNDIRGGGIFVDNAELTVTDSQIRFNSLLNVRQGPGDAGYSDGAGIAALDSILTIEGSTIDSNRSAGDIASGGNSHGGGLSLRGSALYMLDSVVNNNTASGYSIADGGGINAVSSLLQIDNSVIAGNRAGKDRASAAEGDSQGGGVYLLYSSAVFTDSQIRNNAVVTDYASGGGINAVSSLLQIDNSFISGNQAGKDRASAAEGDSQGGGVYLLYSSAVFTDSQIRNNAVVTDYASGGGVWSELSDLRIQNTTVSGNLADAIYQSTGAGIFGSDGRLEVFDSTISGNRLLGDGNVGGPAGFVAGIGWLGSLDIANSTIADNRVEIGLDPGDSAVAGLSLFLDPDAVADASITNTTITGNVTPDGVGGLVLVNDGLVLSNTIIAGNAGGGDGTSEPNDIAGGFTSNGANIFGDTAVAGAIAGDKVGVQAATLFAEIDPETGGGQLRFNGGPTPTVALRDDSANLALDAADPAAAPATDQRGFLRDATPDVGSFELNGVPPMGDEGLEVTTLDDVVIADGKVSLREAIDFANSQAGADTITFADAIRGGTITLGADLPTITDDLVIDGDPLDGGAGGIVVDGDFRVLGLEYGYIPFKVDDAAGRFEDLTIQNAFGVGIDASGADIALQRATIDDTSNTAGISSAVRGDGSLAIVDSVISGTGSYNERTYAARFDGDVTIERSTIGDNGGEYAGGVTVIGDVRVTDSLFIGNNPLDFPEILGVTGSLVIENSSFIDNGATLGSPGGLIDIDGDFQIVNATFAGNASGSSYTGGPPAATILVRGESTGSIVNSTLTGSREELSYGAGPDNAPAPGLYVAPTSQVTIANSIVDDSVVGTITSNGANTFRDPAVDGAVAGDRLGVTAEELFALTEEIGSSGVLAGVAADNGGPTPTVALLRSASNPALDAADPADAPPFDQRGLPRDATPDIGSFELESQPGVALVVTTLDDVVDATDGQLSLREAIDIANAAAGGNEIGFAEAILGGTIALDEGLGTLVITDELVIDGGSGDGGAGGITIDGGLDPGDAEGILPFQVDSTTARFENLAVQGGLGFGISGSDADLTVHQARVGVGPEVSKAGGGISVTGGTLEVRDSVVDISGSGIVGAAAVDLARGAHVTIERSSIGGFDYGPAIAVGGEGRVVIKDSTIEMIGQTYARAIDLSGALLLENSFVTARSGDPGTYGVVIDGTFQITNSTISDINNRDGAGNFAIDAIDASSGTITNSTIGGFRTTRFGYAPPPFDSDANGVRIAPTASVRFENTIVDEHIIGAIESNGANTFRDASVDGTIAGDLLGVRAENIFADVELISGTDTYAGRPGDNGGPTPTIALLDDPANPALNSADRADAPITDQRGFLRDATPDIGAFELDGTPVVVPDTLPPLAEKVPLPDSEIYGAPLFLVGPSGDAEISFVDEYAAFQSSLGVYLVGPDGTIGATEWVFDRIEHSEPSDEASEGARPGGGPLSPGDSVLLSDLFDSDELTLGTGFGLFLVADGWELNDAAIFEEGRLEFRSNGDSASVTDTTPDLVHITGSGSVADATETLVLGDILHTIDAGSANPLSNKLNPGDTGQVTSGFLDGAFTVAFEDKPLSQNSDRDFNDALFAVDAANTAPPVVAQASEPAAVSVETMVTEPETAAA